MFCKAFSNFTGICLKLLRNHQAGCGFSIGQRRMEQMNGNSVLTVFIRQETDDNNSEDTFFIFPAFSAGFRKCFSQLNFRVSGASDEFAESFDLIHPVLECFFVFNGA